MSKTADLHNQAMELTDAARRERRQGQIPAAKELFGQALQRELAAIADLDEPNPLARAILHRSAGWLALDCGQPRLAEKLAAAALDGNPDPAMAEQLREVLAAARQQIEVDGTAAPERAAAAESERAAAAESERAAAAAGEVAAG